jgi:hypothetical protein
VDDHRHCPYSRRCGADRHIRDRTRTDAFVRRLIGALPETGFRCVLLVTRNGRLSLSSGGKLPPFSNW